ncbi:hypothetical protein L5515_001615 [Caenorhabditis briggsae]|uniref:Uncharacterized protein n=1 Tax=Caenorhabditis briggsae TaxID=6238 RepID=A0AAE9DWU9_CAEBR|nr:hypothetical protein L3Y34_015537 [Caenorhabditis briggsae]UMM13235.1 hypothetical protein L5515_001615 [Caenorhabditis briggsae]
MAESIIDFVLVAIILAALAVATLILLFMYSTRIRQPFQKCLGRRTDKTEDVETGIAPKRTTIRVVKSLPNSSLPPTPSAYTKPPIRRVHTNPVEESESPSRQFMFIYPKKPNYQSEQSTFQSGSTRSSYLPERRNSQ